MAKIICYDRYGHPHPVEESEIQYRPSAYAIVIKNNSVLLVLDHVKEFWQFPGGGMDEGETIEEGLAREFIEETGLYLDIPSLKKIKEVRSYYYALEFKCGWDSQRYFYSGNTQHNKGQLMEHGNGHDVFGAKWVFLDEIKNINIKPFDLELLSRLSSHG